jgi:hypothetical protein
MTTIHNDLAPCRICGGIAVEYNPKHISDCYVKCTCCYIRIERINASPQDLREAWNTIMQTISTEEML